MKTQTLLGRARPALLLMGSVVLCGSLAACGGDGEPAAATDPASDAATDAGQDGRDQDRAAGMPGASGLVAALSGTTLQVQNPASGQVAVTYTDATTFTADVAASLADVTVGSCVMAMPAAPAGGGEGEEAPADGPVEAATVRITEPVDGACAGGFGGFTRGSDGPAGGERPERAPTGRPDGAPSDWPSDGPRGTRMLRASGIVTAVTGAGFTVESQRPGEDAASTVEVTVASTTTYVATKDAGADALAVGTCVVATGAADAVGAVTAERIAVSDAVDGECTSMGFGRRAGGGPAGGRAGATGTAS